MPISPLPEIQWKKKSEAGSAERNIGGGSTFRHQLQTPPGLFFSAQPRMGRPSTKLPVDGSAICGFRLRPEVAAGAAQERPEPL